MKNESTENADVFAGSRRKRRSRIVEGDGLTADFGAYILEFELDEALEVSIRSLGLVTLPAGRVRYFGSANQWGGLRARIGRHLCTVGRRDWYHVDEITRLVPIARIRTVIGGHECELVQQDLAAGWVVPVPGFGSSDCADCTAHLLAEPRRLV